MRQDDAGKDPETLDVEEVRVKLQAEIVSTSRILRMEGLHPGNLQVVVEHEAGEIVAQLRAYLTSRKPHEEWVAAVLVPRTAWDLMKRSFWVRKDHSIRFLRLRRFFSRVPWLRKLVGWKEDRHPTLVQFIRMCPHADIPWRDRSEVHIGWLSLEPPPGSGWEEHFSRQREE